MQQLVRAVAEEHAADQEARQALMGLVVRVVDEMRFGLRPIDIDELDSLAEIVSTINGCVTPSEVALDLMAKIQGPAGPPATPRTE
ncbi:MAG: hypothetical protein AB7R77_15580 [Ilumatobacteraceae bacterium]